MEDAHISQSPLKDKKNSLFSVFDGHGGKYIYLFKALKSLLSLKDTLWLSYRIIQIIKKKIMNKLLNRLSSRWITLSSVKREKKKLLEFKNRWNKSKTVLNMTNNLMLDVQLTLFSSLLILSIVQMQVTQDLLLVLKEASQNWVETINQKIRNKLIESQRLEA